MWNLKDEEIARKIQASELGGVWAHDLRVPEGMATLLRMEGVGVPGR